MKPIVIKGCPRAKWEEVQAVQFQPFIYIDHNGSKWAGEEADDVSVLLEMLATYRLDAWWEEVGVATVDPCCGVRNPDWNWGSGPDVPKWINGDRLYACDGVVSFSGNFRDYSHGFGITTNHKPTIDALLAAIEANKQVRDTARV